MTLLDTLRPPRSTDEPDVALPSPWGAGAITALVSALPIVAVTILGWLSAGQRGTGLGQTVGIAADGWLLAHGARLGLTGGSLAFTPLLVFAALLWWARRRALHVVDAHATGEHLWRDKVEIPVIRALAGFVGGYALVGLLLFVISFLAPTRPTWWSIVPALIGVPALAAVIALAGEVLDDISVPERLGVPLTIRRAFPAALRGARNAISVGMLVVVAAMLVNAGQVWHINSQLAPGLVGGVLLWLGQIAVLPNLGLWALSFTAGPGYALTDTASVSWAGAEGALLPLLPVFAASPQPGRFGWYATVSVILPVLVGWFLGRRALDGMPKLAATKSKAGVVAVAALLAALVVGLIDVIGGSALGVSQLANIGAAAPILIVALAAEFLIGASAALGWDLWRLHRR